MLSWLGQQRLLVAHLVLSNASVSDVAALVPGKGGWTVRSAPAPQRYKDSCLA